MKSPFQISIPYLCSIMKQGIFNTLRIARETDYGYFLEDGDGNEVLLPNAYKTDDMSVSDEIEVFIYKDSEDRIVATTLTPYVQLGEFAFLKVKEVNQFGAFLDWGLPKDLMAPFALQTEKMKEGKSYLVYLLLDGQSERLVATSKIQKYLATTPAELQPAEEVELLPYQMTHLGMNAIVNNRYRGLIFHSDIHKRIYPGEKIPGYVKEVRQDGKIDLLLEPPGYLDSVDKNAAILYNAIRENEGFLALNDNSDPEIIKKELGMSKKAFKKALGSLYKQKMIVLEEAGIRIPEET